MGDSNRQKDRGVSAALFKSPFQLAGARSHVLAAACIDGRYRIDLAVPAGEAPAAGWPAVLLLDAEGSFATCVEAVRRMGRRQDATGAGPLAVIGVSALDAANAPALRRRDFTSRQDDHAESGGAPGFLRFLDKEVLALAANEAPLDPGRRTLFGHSLAGYFTLWVLANRPEAFRNYAAISPSIWWDRPALLAGLRRLDRRDRRALLLLGQWEDQIPPWQLAHPGVEEVRARRAGRRLLENAREVAMVLRQSLGDERARFELLADEDHASIVSAAVPRMLRMASS